MIKIEFDNKKLNIPSHWEDIPLGDYERWYLHKPETKADYVDFVAEVCKIDKELLLNSPAQLFSIITDAIQFVFESEFTPVNHIEIDDKKYFVSFSDKLTLGEWIDIESVLENEDETGKLSEILAILCRPAGEAYDPDKTAQRKELFRTQPCDKVLPLVSFFLLRKKRSDEILNHFSAVMEQASQFLKDTKTFAANGDGIKRLPIWQRIRYTCLTKSLEKQLSKYSDSFSTK
jgi:hypothetical protein